MKGMTEAFQLSETETRGHVSIAIPNDCTSVEQMKKPKPKIPEMPPQLAVEMAAVSYLAEDDTSCNVSVAGRKRKARTGKKIILENEIDANEPCRMPASPLAVYERNPASNAIQNGRTSVEQRTIRRVPPHLLEVNRKAYEPYVISFGPYHHGKDHLNEMEERKKESFTRLLQQTNQSDEIYLSAIRERVKEARDCYSKPLMCLGTLEDSAKEKHEISDTKFVEMMVHDGCFIIQLIMKTLADSFCYSGLISTSILRDLVLVENQLPFFVLCELLDEVPKTFFKNLEGSADPKSQFICQLLKLFEGSIPGLRVNRTYDDNSMKNVKHIVHSLHSNWRPSVEAMDEYNKQMDENNKQKKNGSSVDWHFIHSATELREAGIEFKILDKAEEDKKWYIKFEKGKLTMPKVTIDDNTESLYRNLIVCEQFDNELPLCLIDYVTLMDCLIDSGEDVKLLRKSKIIDNLLGDDESVAALFNKLGDHASISRKDFFYAQLFKNINDHYEKRWNKWKANLRQKYFNTPWASISFLAATLLILLTVLQTTFTIFPRS